MVTLLQPLSFNYLHDSRPLLIYFIFKEHKNYPWKNPPEIYILRVSGIFGIAHILLIEFFEES